MSEENIRSRIKELLGPRLNEMGLAPAEVSDKTSLTQSGVLDSFAFLELLAKLEEELGVQLDFDTLDAEQFTTVNGLAASFTKILAT